MNSMILTEAGKPYAHLLAGIRYVPAFRTSRTIKLGHMDEYTGVYKGFERGQVRLGIIVDNCEIFFYPSEVQNLESLTEELSGIPAGSRIGVLTVEEKGRKRVVLRSIR